MIGSDLRNPNKGRGYQFFHDETVAALATRFHWIWLACISLLTSSGCMVVYGSICWILAFAWKLDGLYGVSGSTKGWILGFYTTELRRKWDG
jgi:hypothetical protein